MAPDTPVLPEFDMDDATEVVPALTNGAFFGDRFRIREHLGVGGMGAVYAGIDLQDGDREVAIKVMLKGAQDSQARERFEREYNALASMTHPGTVRIHGFGYDGERQTPWLAMERLEGETLRVRIKKNGPMDPVVYSDILTRAASALEAAHAKGVIHRDLKPDHIFLTNGPERVKLIDFGLSLVRDSKKLTATGTVIGTPRYMAPEQIASAHSSGAPADVYALGVLSYEALTGDSPFVASDHGQLLGAILAGRRKPLREVRPDLPPALDDVLNRAMAPKVEDRFATPGEFARAFEGACGNMPTLARQKKSAKKAPKKKPTKRAKSSPYTPRYWAMLVMGTILSALVGAAISHWVSQ